MTKHERKTTIQLQIIIILIFTGSICQHFNLFIQITIEKEESCEERLDKCIDDIQLKLKKYPSGELFVSRNGKYFKWSFKKDKYSKRENIPKSQRNLAERYAQKKFLTILLEDLIHEKKAIKLYLRHHQKRPWKSERLLTENLGYQELLLSTFLCSFEIRSVDCNGTF